MEGVVGSVVGKGELPAIIIANSWVVHYVKSALFRSFYLLCAAIVDSLTFVPEPVTRTGFFHSKHWRLCGVRLSRRNSLQDLVPEQCCGVGVAVAGTIVNFGLRAVAHVRANPLLRLGHCQCQWSVNLATAQLNCDGAV
eukprot:4242403-Amphidinium_carterae.1